MIIATYARRERVFLSQSSHIQWWAEWGNRKVGRLIIAVVPTLFSSPPI
ncbi:MAG: hypothetical protein RAM37_08135 [Arsenophonus sp.]|nr:hypothetical protein [Arsenophonus sp.]MDR5610428.1 hypothetical protein [Arsenophonus sp.]